MKRLRDPTDEIHPATHALDECRLNTDMLQLTATLVEPHFSTWYHLITTCSHFWKQWGGFVRVLEQYVKNVVKSNNMWHWPQPIIPLSNYVPMPVLDRLKHLPWASIMRDAAPPGFPRPIIAGGYVRTEVIRALRQENVSWVAPNIKILDKARDVDFWVLPDSIPPVEIPLLLWRLAGSDKKQLTKTTTPPESPVWNFYHKKLQQHIEFIRPNDILYCPDDIEPRNKECPPAQVISRNIKTNVQAGFDLSCVQFQLDKVWWETGEVWTTPLALYSLMTGKMVLAYNDPEQIQKRCKVLQELNAKEPELLYDTSIDWRIGRLYKYMTEYGYHLQVFGENAVQQSYQLEAAIFKFFPWITTAKHGHHHKTNPLVQTDYGTSCWSKIMGDKGREEGCLLQHDFNNDSESASKDTDPVVVGDDDDDDEED